MEQQHAKFGRYPSLWLDKVCIDQGCPDNALAVLPINISACKQVLVLLSSTYLSRLWCVWEVFSLFTFCNKELAAERLLFLSLDSNIQLENFHIDHAHCFDPNE